MMPLSGDTPVSASRESLRSATVSVKSPNIFQALGASPLPPHPPPGQCVWAASSLCWLQLRQGRCILGRTGAHVEVTLGAMEGLGPFALDWVGPMWDPPGGPGPVRSPLCPSLAGLRPTSQALRTLGQGLPPASQVSRQVLRGRQPFLWEGTCGGQGLYVTTHSSG